MDIDRALSHLLQREIFRNEWEVNVWTNWPMVISALIWYKKHPFGSFLGTQLSIMSYLYHKSRECQETHIHGPVKIRLAKLEASLSYAMFAYGLWKLWRFHKYGEHQHKKRILRAEMLCMATILTVYIGVGYKGLLSYNRWHWIQHIAPAIAMNLVGYYHVE